jgi:hypothetical protein
MIIQSVANCSYYADNISYEFNGILFQIVQHSKLCPLVVFTSLISVHNNSLVVDQANVSAMSNRHAFSILTTDPTNKVMSRFCVVCFVMGIAIA